MKATETTTIKRAIGMLTAIAKNPSIDECELDAIRALLTPLIAPAPIKAKGIDALTASMTDLGHGIHRFNETASKIANSTPCAICQQALRMARVSVFGGRGCPDYRVAGYAHVGCIAKVETARDAVWIELAAARSALPEFDAVKADTCVCGHRSDRHEKDSLENLLKCRDCADCDHFRMMDQALEIASIPAPAETAETWIANHSEIAAANAISQADRIAMENLNADIEDAEARELGMGADQFD